MVVLPAAVLRATLAVDSKVARSHRAHKDSGNESLTGGRGETPGKLGGFLRGSP
jgi:hypothetical protein